MASAAYSFSTDVYEGILVKKLVGSGIDVCEHDDLRERLLPLQDDIDIAFGVAEKIYTDDIRLFDILAGSALGAVAAIIGLTLLDSHGSILLAMGPISIFAFSLVWSVITAAIAYATLCSMHNITERAFALGVFLGFCTACAFHDAALGVSSVISVIVTAACVTVWGCYMIRFNNNRNNDQMERRGTQLPLMAFVV